MKSFLKKVAKNLVVSKIIYIFVIELETNRKEIRYDTE